MMQLMAAFLVAADPIASAYSAYSKELQSWRSVRESQLRRENGWLSLVGRYALKQGENAIGTDAACDVVFPKELKGAGPSRLGTIHIDQGVKTASFLPAENAPFVAGEKPIKGSRPFDLRKPDWVKLGRIQFHVIVRDGRPFLRLADSEAELRKRFPGCVWYPPDERFRVETTFVAGPPGKTIRIVNILDQKSDEPCAGTAEFTLFGERFRLDAIEEGGALFFVFRDATAGDTTYRPARFLTVEKRPKNGEKFTLDFNRAYNPPCAFSHFTTCPTAPSQNVLKIRIEAGEKYVDRHQ